MTKHLRWISLFALLAVVAACSSNAKIGGEGKSNVVSGTPATSGATATSDAAASATSETTSAATESSNAAPSAARHDIKILEQGFTQLPPDSIGNGYVSYAVTLQNPNDPSAANPYLATNVSLNVTFLDASGAVVGSQSDTLDYILPGQTVADADETQVKGATKMEVKALVDSWGQNDSPITGAFTASSVRTTNDGFADQTVGSVKSTFQKDYKQLIAAAVYYNSAGQIIGGAHTWVDFVPANGTASFSIQGLEDVKGIAKTEVYVAFSNLALMGS